MIPQIPAPEAAALAQAREDRPALYALIVAAHDAGWSYGSIAQPLEVSRALVHNLYTRESPKPEVQARAKTLNFPVPPKPATQTKHYTPKPPLAALAIDSMKTLAQKARKVSRYTGPNEEPALASAKLNSLLNTYNEQGYSLQYLADCIGVTKSAVAQRVQKVRNA